MWLLVQIKIYCVALVWVLKKIYKNKAMVTRGWLIVDFDHMISSNDDKYTQPEWHMHDR